MALWVATPGVPQLLDLAVFVAGVWLMRAAGCVVNDYATESLMVMLSARRNLTTSQRRGRIERGARAVRSAGTDFVLLVLTLNTMTILLSIAALALAWVYPLLKRYTHLPEVLGAAFGWSIPMAFAAVSESVPLSCWLCSL
ncbi:UbiA family prenyltransferase [Escherichia coli]